MKRAVRLWATGSLFALLRGFNCWLISSSSHWMLLTHSGFSGKYNCQWWDGTFAFLHLGPIFPSVLNISWFCPAFLNLVKHRSNSPLKLEKQKSCTASSFHGVSALCQFVWAVWLKYCTFLYFTIPAVFMYNVNSYEKMSACMESPKWLLLPM